MPDEYEHLVIRRILWQQYGIQLPDFGLEDLVLAIKFYSAEQDRAKEQYRKASRSNG